MNTAWALLVLFSNGTAVSFQGFPTETSCNNFGHMTRHFALKHERHAAFFCEPIGEQHDERD